MLTINLIQLELQYLYAIIDGLTDLRDLDIIVASRRLFPQLICDILIVGFSGFSGLDRVRMTMSLERMSLNFCWLIWVLPE